MNITIIGAAKSGVAVAKLASRKGYKVFLSESKSSDNFPNEINLFNDLGINYEFGGNSDKCLEKCDLIVTSPGVPSDIEVFKKADKLGIKIIIGVRKIIQIINAITGTKGKTTTTTLINYIFNKSGKPSRLAGNIGFPISDLVDDIAEDEVVVAELSSFQLDRIDKFRPDVAIILNVTPDHLYYHKTF